MSRAGNLPYRRINFWRRMQICSNWCHRVASKYSTAIWRLQAAARNWSLTRRWSCSNDSAVDCTSSAYHWGGQCGYLWESGASNSCKLTSSWVTSWSDVARIDTQSAKLQSESTEKSAVEHSNKVTIIEKGWNGEHLLYWSRNGEWSESTCPWIGGMCVWWGWGVKTGRGEKLTRKENWWLCLTHVTAWDLILNIVVQTKPWKSSVTCVLLSHLTPATNQNFTDKVTMICSTPQNSHAMPIFSIVPSPQISEENFPNWCKLSRHALHRSPRCTLLVSPK